MKMKNQHRILQEIKKKCFWTK